MSSGRARVLRRAGVAALVGAAVALAVTGIESSPLFAGMPLHTQAAFELLFMCVWPAFLIVANLGYAAWDGWGLAVLVAQCVGLNALMYGLVGVAIASIAAARSKGGRLMT